ncbi:MAG TPA: acyl-CoA dehydrogenase family protein [Polyangiaceae bacterium]|nr:acyl-CoA dehydrogenase family protein [Polyangiaceae bacterium]
MNDALRWLVRPPPPPEAPTLDAWWRAQSAQTSGLPLPVDRALAGGALADRLGYAFAAGYQAALASIFGAHLAAGEIASLCATEAGGNHPKALTTKLEPRGDSFAVTGTKTWSTMVPLAGVLFVVAVAGAAEGGRPLLRLVRVPVGATGLGVEARPPTPMGPEIVHAVVRLEGVVVPAAAVLEGDGYERYLKPFRTVEDVCVLAASVGYLAAAGARRGWPEPLRESLYALGLSLRGLAALDPSAPETHLGLAGALTFARRLFDECAAAWQAAPDDEAARWERDRMLLVIAEAARQKRRESAWGRVGPGAPAGRGGR